MSDYNHRMIRAAQSASASGDKIVGVITFWNVERGFGFARRSDGKADVFVHVDQVAEDVQRLSVGDRVTFELGTDPRAGRPEAKLVTLLDD